LPPRRCDDTWPARGWRTSSARPATDHQATHRAGVGHGVGVVDVVLLIFAGFLVAILIFLFLVVAFDEQRVVFFIFFLVVRALVFLFFFVLKVVVVVLGFLLVSGGSGVLLVEKVEVFECQVAGGLHGASPS